MSTLQSTLNASEIAQVSGGYAEWDTNWCGTRVPGWPRPKSLVSLGDRLSLVALNPQPLPPQAMNVGLTIAY